MKKFNLNKIMNKSSYLYKTTSFYIFNIHRNPHINNKTYLHIIMVTFYTISLNPDLNHFLKIVNTFQILIQTFNLTVYKKPK